MFSSEYKGPKHNSKRRIDQYNQEADAVCASDRSKLDDQRMLILGMRQQWPGDGQKGEIGARILETNPDERGGQMCMNDA